MNSNYTSTREYKRSLYFRFFYKDIFESTNLNIINYFNKYTCFQYFDFKINKKDIFLLKSINKEHDLYFKNINNDSNILNYFDKNNVKYKTIDEWDAPLLKIDRGKWNDYLLSKSNNFRRMINKSLALKGKLLIKSSYDGVNILDLWKDALYVEQNSWKFNEESDMMNLAYEHITEILMPNKKNNILTVAYINDIPMGYSYSYIDKDRIYSIKWGATDEGRKYNSGINCLITQIIELSKKSDITFDFFGRRQLIYDRFKNLSLVRKNIVVERHELSNL